MRVLVTGGAGFVGSHLVEALLARGDSVVVLDNFDDYYSPIIKRQNLSVVGPEIKLIEGDLRDAALLADALAGVDVVAHLAARPGVRASLEQPSLYIDNNVAGTQTLIQAMLDAKVMRLVFASSSSVYGARASGPFREDDVVLKPVSPYAASKLAGEHLCHAASTTWGMHVNCMRLFTVYGPRQRPEMAIHLFARHALAGQAIPRFGRGESLRDYTYVSDVVAGILAAIDRPNGFQVYNIGNDNPVTLDDLIGRLSGALGVSIAVDALEEQPGDVPRTWASIALAAKELDYDPQIPLDEGLRRFVAWLRASRD